MNEKSKELVDLYKQGIYTEKELVNILIDLAIDVQPEEYIPYLPVNIVDDIKRVCANPPKTKSDVFSIGSATIKPGLTKTEIDLYYEVMLLRIFASSWRLKAYFQK